MKIKRKMKKLIIAELILILLLGCWNIYQIRHPKVKEVVKTEYQTVEKDKFITTLKDRKYKECCLNVNPIMQNPELPTGCEITSLTTVLNYFECDVDKITMADKYLNKGTIGFTNPDDAFIGTPFDSHSFGCNANVIVDSGNMYFSENNIDLSIANFTNVEFESFENYVMNGYPIIVWITIDLAEPYISISWDVDGDNIEEVSWLAAEHCVVLIGFDNDNSTYIFSDPLQGIIEYPKDVVIERYNQLGKQAILIY